MTHGLERRPLAAALRANSPAATRTDGFEVLVQLVMAAMTTLPLESVYVSPLNVKSMLCAASGLFCSACFVLIRLV